MSIKLKIAVMLGIPLVALAVLVIYGLGSLGNLSETTDRLVKDRFTPLIEVDFASINTMRGSIKTLLEADRDLHQAVIAEQAIQIAKDPKDREEQQAKIDENIGQADTRIKDAVESLQGSAPEVLELYNGFLEASATWKAEVASIVAEALARPADQAMTRSSSVAFDVMRDEYIDIMQQKLDIRIAAIDKKIGEDQASAAQTALEAGNDAKFAQMAFVGVGVAAVLITFIFGVLIAIGTRSSADELSGLASRQKNLVEQFVV